MRFLQGHLPRKRNIFVYHLYNVGQTSKTLGQRCINVLCLLGSHGVTTGFAVSLRFSFLHSPPVKK